MYHADNHDPNANVNTADSSKDSCLSCTFICSYAMSAKTVVMIHPISIIATTIVKIMSVILLIVINIYNMVMCDVKFQIYIQNMAASYEAAILSDSTKRFYAMSWSWKSLTKLTVNCFGSLSV